MQTLWLFVAGGTWLGLATARKATNASVRVRWFGQSFFTLTASDGTRLVIDPFDNSFFDYPLPKALTADILLVTHEHGDHSNVDIVGGAPLVRRSENGLGSFTHRSMTIIGTPTFHDEQQGATGRGRNTVYSFELDGVRFCHVGDLGHLLTAEQTKSIGPIDVLFMPVGGHFTLDVGKLDRLLEQLNPRVVVPMHFKTRYTPRLPIASVDEFLKGKKHVKQLSASEFTVSKADLPAQLEIWVPDIK
jgi:L-ascorbate metabolism protein UlaG (beta-lactamase superfamily)